MNTLSRSVLLLAFVIVITALVPIFGCPTGGQGQANLTSRVQALENQVAALNAKLAHVSVEQGAINGVNGPHLIIEGCNVHVRDGSGTTEDAKVLNGLGNLIVGYNELPIASFLFRLGSHNVVIGPAHEYPSFGGLVAGENNRIAGPSSSVSGGENNTAFGKWASIAGGVLNLAEGEGSSVSGGINNEANGASSSVSGGDSREAPNAFDWAAGSLFEES